MSQMMKDFKTMYNLHKSNLLKICRSFSNVCFKKKKKKDMFPLQKSINCRSKIKSMRWLSMDRSGFKRTVFQVCKCTLAIS